MNAHSLPERLGLRRPPLRPFVPFVVALAVIVALAVLVLPKGDDPDPGTNNEVAMAEPFTSMSMMTPSATPESTPTLRAELTGFKTPEPTPTARVVKRVPTAAVTATATPRYQPEQYVTNGGFEHGIDGWYVEPDAAATGALVHRGTGALQIGTGGGFASLRFAVSAETAYRLSAWGLISVEAESATIGVEYFDTAGQSLGTHPTPLTFTKPEFVSLALTFVPPPGAATAQIYVWKPSGQAIFVADDISVRAFIVNPNDE
jgi:hypothetical protein